MRADFIAFAASVLGVAPERLSPETACGDIPEWDSVMHLRLVMEAEARYGVSIPLETIPNLRTLADFAQIIETDSSSTPAGGNTEFTENTRRQGG